MSGSGSLPAFGFVIAAALFAGDLTLRQYAGHGLFPFAAPTGGTLLIASWLAVAIAAAWPRQRLRRLRISRTCHGRAFARPAEPDCGSQRFAPCPPIG